MRPRKSSRTLLLSLLLLPALAPAGASSLHMPWEEAGLGEREAAAHLLSRFTFGSRPGDIDAVVAQGLEIWFERQLTAQLPEPRLDARLVGIESLFLSVEEMILRYPNPGLFVRQAMEAGVLPEDFDPQQARENRVSGTDRLAVVAFGRERGYRPQRELIADLTAQKILRGVYAENQLQEVLTDFWFNHFNVSLTDDQCRGYVLSYERDAIRPFVLGDFRDLLGATARHPAMLLYLDNAQSTAAAGDETTLERRLEERRRRGGWGRAGWGRDQGVDAMRRIDREPSERPQGLNENYARELLELHTLGVDGGYTQEDVVEVARAFTGWSAVPAEAMMSPELRRRIQRALALDAGFVLENGFVFRADVHDAAAKNVLGRRLAAGRGLEDGEEVLDLLASHPATAVHLARKLAMRFVSDDPPARLVERLAGSFSASGGKIRPVLREIVSSPEFWTPEARGDKIKSPFELAVSALRAVSAEVVDPRGLVEWVERMGQPLYAYQAPTGYPDTSEFWVSSGALLNRMNFGLALAGGTIPGIRFDLATLGTGRTPQTGVEPLHVYVALLLPERDAQSLTASLEPMALAPELDEGIEHVVGLILGSPEFQKR